MSLPFIKNKTSSSDLDDDLQLNIATIKFQCEYQTQFGQQLRICGNLEELGSWDLEKSMIMETNESLFQFGKVNLN